MTKIGSTKKEVAFLISYFLTCARGLVDEPLIYALSRYLNIMILLKSLLEDNFFYQSSVIDNLVEGIDEVSLLCMTDVTSFIREIDKKIEDMEKEIIIDNNDPLINKFFFSMIKDARKLVDETSIFGPYRLLTTLLEFYNLIRARFDFNDKDINTEIEKISQFVDISLQSEDEFVAKLDASILRMVDLVNNYYISQVVDSH